MKSNPQAMLALLGRIARVREVHARQKLADAVAQEDVQRKVVQATSKRLFGIDEASCALQRRRPLDLARMALYSQLASSVGAALSREQQMLLERCETRVASSGDLVRATHHREHVNGRLREAAAHVRREVERRGSDERMENWLLRCIRRVSP